MKKLFPAALAALLLALTISTSAQAQIPFLLNKVGAVAEYETKGSDGSVLAITRMTVTKIDSADERNYTVNANMETFDANRQPVTAPIATTTKVQNGAVVITSSMPGVEAEGTFPTFPADMNVGYEHEYSSTVKMMGMSATTSGKDRVVARESLTTPAGTFDCFKIESDVTVNTMGQNQNMKTVTWLSAGVGTAKMEIRDGAGSMQMTQELVSLK
jgi:hypothetical protein